MSYTDISTRSAFSTEISWCYDAGLLTGWRDGSFRPLIHINRNATAALLHRLAGSPSRSTSAHPYKDVRPGDAFAEEIAWCHEAELLTGWRDRTFRPFSHIARDATAAMLYRFAGEPAYTPPTRSPFKDVHPRQAFYKEICWAHSAGITTGWSDGTFKPLDHINRNAMAAFVYRFDKHTT